MKQPITEIEVITTQFWWGSTYHMAYINRGINRECYNLTDSSLNRLQKQYWREWPQSPTVKMRVRFPHLERTKCSQ